MAAIKANLPDARMKTYFEDFCRPAKLLRNMGVVGGVVALATLSAHEAGAEGFLLKEELTELPSLPTVRTQRDREPPHGTT